MLLSIVLAVLTAGSASPDPTGGAFLDTDLDSLELAAREAYGAGDWEGAAAAYVEMLEHDVTNATGIYNASCCFGLMGEDTLAAVYLRAAVRAGFSDPYFALEDPDFDEVRESDFFSGVLDSLLSTEDERMARLGELDFTCVRSLVPVRIVYPEGFDPEAEYPLVVGLHGYGSSAESFIRLYETLEDPGFVFAVPESPYPFISGREPGYSWSTWSMEDSLVFEESWSLSSELVRDVVRDLRSRFDISSTWLFGFSQGSSLAYTAGFENSEIVDGMICFGGYLVDDSSLLEEIRLHGPQLCVFIAHGLQDRSVGIEEGRHAFGVLDSLGCPVVMREFEGGHTVPGIPLEEAVIWMNELDREIRGL